VGFPALADDSLRWAFVRGYFDGDGSISSIRAAWRRTSRGGYPAPRCSIASTSGRLLDAIAAFCGIPAHRASGGLEWGGTSALDFLGRLYDGATIYLARKHDLYLDWCHWIPCLSGTGRHGSTPFFRWAKTMPAAVPPTKAHASDSGFDLTLVERSKSHGMLQFFRTGIRVQPAFGWYFDLVPRSSIVKTGYILANSIGVIDRGYVGEILVPLLKVDAAAPDLPLPSRIVQMVPRPIVAARLIQVASLEETPRGQGGFGSTGS
jgi:dUTP pyrophosphatase